MRQIQGLTNDGNQKFFAVIDGYDSALISLEFKPQQYGWFMALEWGSVAVKGIRVTTGFNILRQFKNKFPFGIAVSGIGSLDPYTIDDWTNGHNNFYILDSSEVEEVETLING